MRTINDYYQIVDLIEYWGIADIFKYLDKIIIVSLCKVEFTFEFDSGGGHLTVVYKSKEEKYNITKFACTKLRSWLDHKQKFHKEKEANISNRLSQIRFVER